MYLMPLLKQFPLVFTTVVALKNSFNPLPLTVTISAFVQTQYHNVTDRRTELPKQISGSACYAC